MQVVAGLTQSHWHTALYFAREGEEEFPTQTSADASVIKVAISLLTYLALALPCGETH